MFICACTYSRLCVSPTIMDAGLQALFWFLLKKRTRNSRLTARAIRQRSSSEKMYRIRRKTRLTVLLLTSLVSHFTVERSFRQILRTTAWFDLTYSTYYDDQWYASFRVSKNTFQFLLLIRMWRTLNNWRGALRALKKRNRTVPKKGRAFTRWKENENVGTEPPMDLFRNGTDTYRLQSLSNSHDRGMSHFITKDNY